jgi:hypothetical protein
MITKRISFGNSRRQIIVTKGGKFSKMIYIGNFNSNDRGLSGKPERQNVHKPMAVYQIWLIQPVGSG